MPLIHAPDDALARALQRAAGTSRSEGNDVTLLIDGEATYAAMHARIAQARRQIHFENYIFRADQVGRGFADALMARARDGVEVRVLYDWLGSLGTPHRFWRDLRSAGVQVRPFGPPQLSDPLLMMARDHRKLLVVDGTCTVSGGLCIGDEWIGNPAERREGWRDTALAVDGPAGQILDAAFARSWRFAGGEVLPEVLVDQALLNSAGRGVAVQVVATEPGRERASRAIDLMVGASSSRLWVTDAYLALPQRLYQAFRDAAEAGVDVRLLLPGISDIPGLQQLARSGYRNLLRSGVRIFEWGGPMLHAKSLVVDSGQVRVGSSNLNPSSLLANWELDLIVDGDMALAEAMKAQFLDDLDRSSEILLRPWRQTLLANSGVRPLLLKRRDDPEAAPQRGQRSFRERRGRAFVLAAGLIRGARAAIFGPIALILCILAALFLLFPLPMAWGSAVLSGALGLALLIRASGHRTRA